MVGSYQLEREFNESISVVVRSHPEQSVCTRTRDGGRNGGITLGDRTNRLLFCVHAITNEGGENLGGLGALDEHEIQRRGERLRPYAVEVALRKRRDRRSQNISALHRPVDVA